LILFAKLLTLGCQMPPFSFGLMHTSFGDWSQELSINAVSAGARRLGDAAELASLCIFSQLSVNQLQDGGVDRA